MDDLEEPQQRFIEALLRVYPRSKGLRDILEPLQLTYAAGEILAENLEALGLVQIIQGFYQTKSVLLTKQGRDLCYKAGLDLLG